jgi:SAM-dependent methyltransferase
MERREYELMAAVEDRLWWYRGLRALAAELFARHAGSSGQPILDAGCGTGGLLARLIEARLRPTPVGLEYDPTAAGIAVAKSGRPVAVGSVNELPFADRTLSGMFSLDVLCHRMVEPDRALAEAHRCLESGGILLLNLPAYRWLASAHDARVHNARRFGRREAVGLLEAAGFRIKRATHWNSFLFPLMVLRRLVSREDGASDVRPFPAPLNALFGAIVAAERRLIGWGLDLPFGGSIMLVAEKR